ncbi:Hypothetical protein A7982_07137 [Minicystis rosea]|nr:Hypothetical protein A7982_07137 [Minicystis rosea]
MTTYYMNEAAFDLPDVGFVDGTVHSLEVALPRNRELRLLVARFPLTEGQAFGDAITAHVRKQSARVSGYAVTERRDTEVHGRAAVLLRSRWRSDEVKFYERQAHIAATPAARMVIAMTGPAVEQAACDEHFDRILETLKLRDAEPSA